MEPPEARLKGLKMKAARCQTHPRTLKTPAYRVSGGKCLPQPADSWPLVNLEGSGEECPQWHFRESTPRAEVLSHTNPDF